MLVSTCSADFLAYPLATIARCRSTVRLRRLAMATLPPPSANVGFRSFCGRLYQPDGTNVDLVRRRLIEDGARIALQACRLTDRPDYCPLLLNWTTNCCWPVERTVVPPRHGCNNPGGSFSQTGLSVTFVKMAAIQSFSAGCNFPNCPRTSIYRPRNATSDCPGSEASRLCTDGLEEMPPVSEWMSTCRRYGLASPVATALA